MSKEARLVGPFTYHACDAQPRPRMALLFGWADAKEKFVAKYAALYNQMNMDALVTTSSSLHFFSDRLLRRSFSVNNDAIFTYLAQDQKACQPDPGASLIVHVFSNGGLLKFRTFFREWNRRFPNRPLNITHIICDSVPGGTPGTGATALTLWIPIRPFRWIAWAVVFGMLNLNVFWRYLVDFGRRGSLISSNIVLDNATFLAQDVLLEKCPQLYLYSNTDALIPMDQVQQHLRLCRSHGRIVKEFMFDGSEHVQHLRKYPDQYRRLIGEFVEK